MGLRPQLVKGKLIPPATVEDAAARRGQLSHEMTNISAQLADPNWSKKFGTMEGYREWRRRADRALRFLQSEYDQLSTWITDQKEWGRSEAVRVRSLHKRVATLLTTLLDEVPDLDPEERAVMREFIDWEHANKDNRP